MNVFIHDFGSARTIEATNADAPLGDFMAEVKVGELYQGLDNAWMTAGKRYLYRPTHFASCRSFAADAIRMG